MCAIHSTIVMLPVHVGVETNSVISVVSLDRGRPFKKLNKLEKNTF